MPKSKYRIGILAALLVASAGIAYWFLSRQSQQAVTELFAPEESARLIETNARQLLAAGRFEEALATTEIGLREQPTAPGLLIIAGESATQLGRYDLALDFYNQVEDSNAAAASLARWAAGEVCFRLGQPSACIERMRQSIALDPQRLDAHERMLWMLCDTGQRSEISAHALALLKGDRVSIPLLVELGNQASDFQNWREFERYRTSAPDDLLPNLMEAKRVLRQGNFDRADELIDALLEQQPDLREAHIVRGKLWTISHPEQWNDWNDALPKSANESPDIWFVRGQWQELIGSEEGAIRCYAEAVIRSPNHVAAHLNLARLLSDADPAYAQIAATLGNRAETLQQYHQTIDRLRVNARYEETVRQAAELSLQLSRIWESVGWCGQGARLNPKNDWGKKLLEEIRQIPGMGTDMPQTLASGHLLAQATWINNFELPDFSPPSSTEGTSRLVDSRSDQQLPQSTPYEDSQETIRFEDIGQSMGIHHTYHNSSPDRSQGRRMFEFTGGGVGVIDFDGDGLEEFFLPQATDWPQSNSSTQQRDLLSRNLGIDRSGNVSFEDASLEAGIIERSYGQGVTVADINADGFDDIYVANFGTNQLWLNQGDGTFESRNNLLDPIPESSWTASNLVVDLNGDSIPDLIDINYVTGENVETMKCDVDGKPRVCPPLEFEPETLAIMLSDKGRAFRPFDWNGNPLTFNGLGGIAFRSLRSSSPKLFVAVDQKANGLISCEKLEARDDSSNPALRFTESAVLSGIAYNRDGRAEACMGIAAGDLSGNGELDFFVTNFYGESNTLYVQEEESFTDRTLRSGLAGPSRLMLGFGTQLLDINLDGQIDLVVLNGHIDDFSHVNTPEKMLPQIFINQGKGMFKEYESTTAGSFFQRPGLGRALARCDINQDGLADLLCTDLESPFTVLLNRSRPSGDFISLRIIGTQSDRNGFLALVQIETEGYQSKQQLVAGGGYMASNSRSLHFGLPHQSDSEGSSGSSSTKTGSHTLQATVTWPSGIEEVFSNLEINAQTTLIEGRGHTLKEKRLDLKYD